MALMVLPIFMGPRMLVCNVRRMVLVPTFEHLHIYLDRLFERHVHPCTRWLARQCLPTRCRYQPRYRSVAEPERDAQKTRIEATTK
jgi:hypothetical protein